MRSVQIVLTDEQILSISKQLYEAGLDALTSPKSRKVLTTEMNGHTAPVTGRRIKRRGLAKTILAVMDSTNKYTAEELKNYIRDSFGAVPLKVMKENLCSMYRLKQLRRTGEKGAYFYQKAA